MTACLLTGRGATLRRERKMRCLVRRRRAAVRTEIRMRVSTQFRIWCCCTLAGFATLAAACRQADVAGERPPVGQASRATRPGGPAPKCVYRANGFRSGLNPPRNFHREEPDLSGLPPIIGEQIVIIEVRIDAAGRVTESCMLRGVREDVDLKALEAVKAWRFEPPRLLADTDLDGRGGRLKAGTAVPIFMTVTMRLGQRQ